VYATSNKSFHYTTDANVSSDTELTHVVTTTIVYGGNICTAIYVNGELKATNKIQGKIYMTSADYIPYANQLSICNDIGKKGFPTTDCTVVDVKVYAQCLNAEQVKTAYNNAAALFAN
jgi:anaerobic ribonucleoside-triphosphate reductase